MASVDYMMEIIEFDILWIKLLKLWYNYGTIKTLKERGCLYATDYSD